MKLVVVTATTNYDRATPCLDSWGDVQKVIVSNGSQADRAVGYGSHSDVCVVQGYLGTVPAFRLGVDYALEHSDADILCAFHDDLEILDPSWAEKVIRLFERHPQCGLAGFGGAIGLGSDDLYRAPYDPLQLARIGFRSNLVDAEVHGVRSLLSERVACLDGFSQIGRREFYEGLNRAGRESDRPWTYFEEHGIFHHLYDSLLGAYAARLGWEAWYVPVRARHLGGQTAVGDQGYQAWAQGQIPGGDQGFWQQSHQRGYQLFKDVLPIRL
jgi:hypothetical protein